MARDLFQLIVSNGVVKKLDGGTLSIPTNNSGGDLSTGTFDVRSVVAFGDAFYVDGAAAKYYKASTGTIEDWEADISAGSFPKSGSNYPRLIALWRGRALLSGIEDEPFNVFMSKATDPFDFEYGASPRTETMAVALNLEEAGAQPDIVTAMIPWTDEILVLGCEHTINILRGDPAAGGQRDVLSEGTGIVWGDAWAIDDEETIYFFGNNGVYRLAWGTRPTSLTDGRLDAVMNAVDHSTHVVRLAWDFFYKGLHVFVTPSTSASTLHYYWDRRTDSWWIDQYPDDHGPTAVAAVNGDAPSDRALLLGGFDGYVRQQAPSSFTDDGTAIESYVIYPPVRITGNSNDILGVRLMMALAELTTNLDWEVRVGNSPEEAFNAGARESGTFTSGGRRNDIRHRVRGNSLCLKVGNSTSAKTWGIEDITMEVAVAGRTRV